MERKGFISFILFADVRSRPIGFVPPPKFRSIVAIVPHTGRRRVVRHLFECLGTAWKPVGFHALAVMLEEGKTAMDNDRVVAADRSPKSVEASVPSATTAN